jgi:GNAT superfamily N-acetyltransferase
MGVRRFTADDAEFCCRVRNRAYIVEFRQELSPHTVAAAVNAYLPADYVRMSEEAEVFVVEDGGAAVGFFTLKRTSRCRAELPLIYLHHEHMGRGIGTRCLAYIQDWIRSNWPEVSVLFVDTIIPNYNGGFYRKVGFEQVGETVCDFPNESAPAIRFEKRLGAESPPRPTR